MHLCPDELVPLLMVLPGIRILVARIHAWWHRRRHNKCHAPGSAPQPGTMPAEAEHDVVGEPPAPANVTLVEQDPDDEEIVEVGSDGRVYRRGEAPRSGIARQITILRDPRGEY